MYNPDCIKNLYSQDYLNGAGFRNIVNQEANDIHINIENNSSVEVMIEVINRSVNNHKEIEKYKVSSEILKKIRQNTDWIQRGLDAPTEQMMWITYKSTVVIEWSEIHRIIRATWFRALIRNSGVTSYYLPFLMGSISLLLISAWVLIRAYCFNSELLF